MGAFGPNAAMKQAVGYPTELGNWFSAQLPQQFGRSQAQTNIGNNIQDWLAQWYHDQMVNGAPTPQQQKDWGSQIMPGIQSALDSRKANLDDIQRQWSSLPTSGDTMGIIDRNTRQQGQNIGQNQDVLQGSVDDTYRRTSGRDSTASNDIQGNIASGYGSINTNLGNAYHDMTGHNDAVYEGLKTDAPNTFDAANANLEMLKPGSQFQQAQVARSFAPAVAATSGMLRRGGIDPNSPEAFAAQQRVEASRSRAMDDAAGAGTQNYVNSKNALALQRLQNTQGLTQSQLGNDLSLGDRSIQSQTGVGMTQTGQSLAEKLRTLQAQQNLDLGQSAESRGIQRDAFGQTQRFLDSQNSNALLGRNMGQVDWQTQAGLLREQNQEPLLGLQLNNQAYGLGRQYGMDDQQIKQQGAQGWGNIMTNSQGQAQQAFMNALASGKSASEAYQLAYAMNAPNSGWATKLLAGAAGPLASMIPGVGPLLGPLVGGIAPGLAGGLTGTTGMGGGGFGGGAGAGGSFSGFDPSQWFNGGVSGGGLTGGMNQTVPGGAISSATGGMYSPNMTASQGPSVYDGPNVTPGVDQTAPAADPTGKPMVRMQPQLAPQGNSNAQEFAAGSQATQDAQSAQLAAYRAAHPEAAAYNNAPMGDNTSGQPSTVTGGAATSNPNSNVQTMYPQDGPTAEAIANNAARRNAPPSGTPGAQPQSYPPPTPTPQQPAPYVSSAQWDEPWRTQPTANANAWTSSPTPYTPGGPSVIPPNNGLGPTQAAMDANAQRRSIAASGTPGVTPLPTAQPEAPAGPTAEAMANNAARRAALPPPMATHPLNPDGSASTGRATAPVAPAQPVQPTGPTAPMLPDDQQNPWAAKRLAAPRASNPWATRMAA